MVDAGLFLLESVEGIVAIKTGILYNISEQQLIDCLKDRGIMGVRVD